MNNRGRFPTKDADFLMAVTIIINYFNVAGNKSRLVITPVAIAALLQATSSLASFNTVLLQCQNPSLVNASLVASKNLIRSQLEAALRVVYPDIQKSMLTTSDRETLNIPLPSTSRSIVAIPSIIPAIEIYEQNHGFITFNLKDAINSKNMTFPEGTSNVELQYIPLQKDDNGNIMPNISKDYRAFGFANKVKYTARYDDDIIGQTVIVRARYINTRNQSGPWSHPVTITLI